MNYRVILGILMGLVSVLNGPARAAHVVGRDGILHVLVCTWYVRRW